MLLKWVDPNEVLGCDCGDIKKWCTEFGQNICDEA